MMQKSLISAGRCVIGILGGIVLLAGCDSGTPVGKVSGVVTYEGKPLASAEVEFTPQGPGTSSVGFTNQQGVYELQYTLQKKGALPGKHKVRVQLLTMNEKSQAQIRRASQVAQIECEVSMGSNEINIDLPAVKDNPKGRKRRR